MEIEEKELQGFKMKIVSIGDISVGIPSNIGPRILYLAGRKRAGFNLFGILPNSGVQTSQGFWRTFGGHRLWSSPEAMPRSYSPDDKPIGLEMVRGAISIIGNPEVENSIQKEIRIRAFSQGRIQVIHTIRNIGRWPVRLACWALSVMRQNGFAIIPVESSKDEGRGLLPDRHFSIWPYDDLSDRRLRLADQYILVDQDPSVKDPFKIGAMSRPTWVAYHVDGIAFVKQFLVEEGEYPDFGCNVEVYTNADMLELETIGPLKVIEPSGSIEHAEYWSIFDVGQLTHEPNDITERLGALIPK